MRKLIIIQIIALFIVSVCKAQNISAYQPYIEEVEKRVANLSKEGLAKRNWKKLNNAFGTGASKIQSYGGI